MDTQKIIVVSIFVLLIGTCFVPLISGSSNPDPVIITVDESDEVIEISYKINDFEEKFVDIDGTEYSIIKIGEESNLLEAGKPDIPNICRSIVIPDTAKMKVNVGSMEYIDYNNILIAPSKGNLLRTVNPDNIPFEFGEVYNIDDWFPGKIAELRDPYIIRDFRGQVVEIYPIQYNPVTKVMRFYNEITVEVVTDGEDTINCIYQEDLPEKVDFDFKLIYEQHFINFGISGRYNPVGEQGNLLIICYDDFMDEMEPFVEWKTIKGIPAEIVKVSEIGNANAIKTYIADYYSNEGLTFVLLVGDVAQIPTLYVGSSGSDPSYTYVVGSDHYPDLFVGRFSAQNSDHVKTQVERSVEYEKYPQSGAEWYHKGVGVASSYGPGDDGEMDYQHIRNIRTKLLDYTYDEVDELYDGSQDGEDAPGDPTPSTVSDAVNDGRSIINYCGHGGPGSWGSSGFSTSDINTLVNDNMLPYVTCVACNNGQFDDYDECFCETWLRATNNGEPAGGIAATGSTKGMSQDPPMDAQDEFIDLIVASYTDKIKHTIGGIHYNGVIHMNDEYGYSGESETDTWHVFGDPSLEIRTDTPVAMVVDHHEQIDKEATSFEVFVQDVEGALCALSRNGEILGYEYTNEYGVALIQLDEPVMGEEPLGLVVTSYNKIPYITELSTRVNGPPEVPDKPYGPTEGKVGESQTYSTSTVDPNGDDISYGWDWNGDGVVDEWTDFKSSGTPVSTSHTWTSGFTGEIKVKGKDTNDELGPWSDPLSVSMPKNKNEKSMNTPFLRFLQNFLSSHSNLFPLLRQFLLRL